MVGQRMSEITRQPVIIDNRGGQAGVLGTDAVAKSTPDGYTIRYRERERARHQSDDGKGPGLTTLRGDFAPVTLVTTVPDVRSLCLPATCQLAT